MTRAPKHPKPRRTGDDLRLVALVALAAVCIVSVVTAVAVLVALKRLDADAITPLASGATGVAGMALGRLSGAGGTVTHSAAAGATLITGSTTSQAQGKRLRGRKVAPNTWLLG